MSILPYIPAPERARALVGAGPARPAGNFDSAAVRVQRADLHLDLPDALLIALAAKAGEAGGVR